MEASIFATTTTGVVGCDLSRGDADSAADHRGSGQASQVSSPQHDRNVGSVHGA
jgi:hypothetical protein